MESEVLVGEIGVDATRILSMLQAGLDTAGAQLVSLRNGAGVDAAVPQAGLAATLIGIKAAPLAG